jgi:chromosome segregation ATPase
MFKEKIYKYQIELSKLKENSQKIIEDRTNEINSLMTNELQLLFLTRENERLTSKNMLLVNENEIFESQWDAEKNKNAACDKLLEEKQCIINDLEKKMESLIKEHEISEKSNANKILNLESRLKEEIQNNKLKESIIESHESKIASLESSIQSCHSEMSKFKIMLEKEIKDNEYLKMNKQKSIKDTIDLKSTITRLESKNKELEHQLDSVNINNSILQNEYQKASLELNKLIEEHEVLKKDFEIKKYELEASNLKYAKEIESSQNEINHLKTFKRKFDSLYSENFNEENKEIAPKESSQDDLVVLDVVPSPLPKLTRRVNTLKNTSLDSHVSPNVTAIMNALHLEASKNPVNLTSLDLWFVKNTPPPSASIQFPPN